MKSLRQISLLSFVCLLLLALSSTAAVADEPLYLVFDKTAIAETIWEGTVEGDIDGNLETELLSLKVTGPIWHVRFRWSIVDAGDRSFEATLKGTLHTKTGRVVMNGPITSGYLEGAQVHEEGQLVNLETFRFKGIIRIMPSTAD